MRNRRRLVLAAAFLAAVWLVAAVWPQGGRLETYTSPVMRIGAKNCRFRIQAPRGWVATAPTSYLDKGKRVSLVTFRPRPRMKWAPEWLRKVFGATDEPMAELDVQVAAPGVWAGVSRDTFSASTGTVSLPGKTVSRFQIAIRTLSTQDGDANVSYYRANETEFDGTNHQILDSVKIIP